MGPLSPIGIGTSRPQASCQFPSAETLILNQATCSQMWWQGEVPGLLSLMAGGCVIICAWYQMTPGPSTLLLLMLRGSVEFRASLLPQPEVAPLLTETLLLCFLNVHVWRSLSDSKWQVCIQ